MAKSNDLPTGSAWPRKNIPPCERLRQVPFTGPRGPSARATAVQNTRRLRRWFVLAAMEGLTLKQDFSPAQADVVFLPAMPATRKDKPETTQSLKPLTDDKSS